MYDADATRLAAELRRTRRFALAATALALLASTAAAFAVVHTPGRLVIGNVSIDGDGIEVTNGRGITTIAPGSVVTGVDSSSAILSPASLEMVVRGGAGIRMWADDHATKLSMFDRSSDHVWEVGVDEHRVSGYSRPPFVDELAPAK